MLTYKNKGKSLMFNYTKESYFYIRVLYTLLIGTSISTSRVGAKHHRNKTYLKHWMGYAMGMFHNTVDYYYVLHLFYYIEYLV